MRIQIRCAKQKNSLHHVTKHDENLVEAATRTRESMFDFKCPDELKNHVLKNADCNSMTPNHTEKPVKQT